MTRILGLLLFTQVSAITNKSVIDEGFCHLQKVKLQVFLDCKLNYNSTVYIALAVNRSDISGNFIWQCVLINEASTICYPKSDATGFYDESSDIFGFEFIFKQNIHGGYYLRIKTDCSSSYAFMRPCISGFTVNANIYNSSAINVTCQHSSFIYSNHPITIQSNRGIQYGSCTQNNCDDGKCKNFPHGIQCVLQYDPDEILQCQLDGAISNITTQSSDITPTSSDSFTSQNTETTESLEGSSTSQSITSTSPEASTSQNGITTQLTSTEITESEQDIHITSKGSTDVTANLPNVKQPELSRKFLDWDPPLVYYVILIAILIVVVIIVILWMRRKNQRERRNNEDADTEGDDTRTE